MNESDLQLLRHAALELQEDGDDLVRVAGIIQRIKNWWKAFTDKKYRQQQEIVEDSYHNLKGPLSELIGQLSEMDKAFKSQDPETVAQLVGQVPGTIARVTRDMGKLSKEMRAADAMIPVSYVDDKGHELSPGSAEWVTKGYGKNKELVQKLWERLPEEYRNEIPVGQPINRPMSDFSWFARYDPSQIIISENVIHKTREEQFRHGLELANPRLYDEQIDEIIDYSYNDFLENLKVAILNDGILERVDFPGISKDITHRPSNQMLTTVNPGFVKVPYRGFEFSVKVAFVKMHDIGAAYRNRPQLSVFMIRTISIDSATAKWLQQIWQGVEAESEPVPSEVEEPLLEVKPEDITEGSDGPITKIVKRAIIRQNCPLTQAVVEISGQTLHHKVRFAKILSSALRQEIDAECSVRHQDDDVEVQVKVYGTKISSLPAIYGISTDVAEKFLDATKIGVDVEVKPGISSFGLIETDVLDESFRKVAFDSLRLQ